MERACATCQDYRHTNTSTEPCDSCLKDPVRLPNWKAGVWVQEIVPVVAEPAPPPEGAPAELDPRLEDADARIEAAREFIRKHSPESREGYREALEHAANLATVLRESVEFVGRDLDAAKARREFIERALNTVPSDESEAEAERMVDAAIAASNADFLKKYREIVDQRMVAQKAGDKVAADALLVRLNESFGKFGGRAETDLADRLATGENVKYSNPKDAIGANKVPMSVVPAGVLLELALGMLEGGCKYGRHNYRAIGVRASIYYDAACGHLMDWWEGDDIDADSGLSHVIKAMASLAVLRDAMLQGKCVDDRPPRSRVFKRTFNPMAAEIIARHADKAPHHYVTGEGYDADPPA